MFPFRLFKGVWSGFWLFTMRTLCGPDRNQATTNPTRRKSLHRGHHLDVGTSPKEAKGTTSSCLFFASVFNDAPSLSPVSANGFRLAWDRLRGRAGLSNLRFHDLRHEAISRFFELGLNIPEEVVISGHKDPRILFRYTHLRAESLIPKLE